MSNVFAYCFFFMLHKISRYSIIVQNCIFHELQRMFEQCSFNCIHSHVRMSFTERKKRYLTMPRQKLSDAERWQAI
jgi:hypothetical protein